MAQETTGDDGASGVPGELGHLLTVEPASPSDDETLADQLAALMRDEPNRPSRPVGRRITAPPRPLAGDASPVELDATVVDAVTLAIDASIERLLPGLVEEAVARAVAMALPSALAAVIPGAVDDAVPAALDRTLPEAVEEAITDLVEQMAPSPALERATDALRRLRARNAG